MFVSRSIRAPRAPRTLFITLAALLLVTPLAAQTLEVGSVTDARFGTSWTLDGGQMANTRAKLLNPANFGPAGTVTTTINITDTGAAAGSITNASLAGFDVFFIGWLADGAANAFTASELAALETFASNGGTLIVTCDDTGHDAVCESLGYPVTDGSTSPFEATAAGLGTTIFNGPFGAVTEFNASGNYGSYSPTTGATVIARDTSGTPQATMLLRTVGSGTIIFIADVDVIANAASPGATITTANDRVLGNLFAFAAGVEPTPTTEIPTLDEVVMILLGAALAFAGIVAIRRI